ncbi:Protein of unknown function [Pyronema omphalodes CBS 100304]|uniref:Uncharacterized protein n=1 Tax=Pyronema omphalodes (strain CBS 100304) TaxID=1076935 RepID=U4LVG3_PYROM|nr:Protein of unknown function [Pyronema omphalodes CBS 100304]
MDKYQNADPSKSGTALMKRQQYAPIKRYGRSGGDWLFKFSVRKYFGILVDDLYYTHAPSRRA